MMNTMHKYMAALLLAPVLVACNQKKVEDLTTENQQLSTQKQELSTELEAYMKTFNEIEANLKEIKAREDMIDLNTSDVESNTAKSKEAVVRDIQAINALMAENKEKMDKLQSTLNTNSAEFRQMVSNLKRRLNEKNEEVANLKENLEQLNIEKQELAQNVESLSYKVDTLSSIKNTQSDLIARQNEKLEKQSEALTTGYVAIGTYKDLKEEDVLTKEGGILGIGSTERLKDNFNNNAFSKIDINKVNTIPVLAKKVELVTPHPEDSYELSVNDENEIEQLVILDPEKFWNSSKYLVVMIN